MTTQGDPMDPSILPDLDSVLYHALRDAGVSFESATVMPALVDAVMTSEALRLVRSDAWESGFYAASDGEFMPEPGDNPHSTQ